MQEIFHASNSGFWARHPGAGSHAVRAGSLLIACVLLIGAAPTLAREPWTLAPFLSVSGGHESNLLLDPAAAAVVVPGGTFMDISPGLEASNRFSRRLNLHLGTRGTAERFLNETSRTLYGHVAWGDLFVSLSPRIRLRASLSGDYFNDTEQSALRRWGGGGELGIDFQARRFRLEGFVGGRGVSYPRADALNNAGQLTSYRENRWNLGGAIWVAPVEQLVLRASLVTRSTNSIDPQYDGSALLGDMSLRWVPRRRLALDLHYGRQGRGFDHRISTLDDDSYSQWGVGMNYELSHGVSLAARWSKGIYTDPEGNEQDTDRVEVALRLGLSIFGARSVPVLPSDLEFMNEAPPGPTQSRKGIVFRVHAPKASQVGVTGDFEGWRADGEALKPLGGGWWQLTLKIPPGHYQYLYLIDGQPLTPPESVIVVDDGFGGRNGLLEVR